MLAKVVLSACIAWGVEAVSTLRFSCNAEDYVSGEA